MSEEMEKNLANEEAYYTGLQEGEDKGIIQGKLETQTLIVKNLLFNSIPDDIIIKSTNISKEELDNIKKEIK